MNEKLKKAIAYLLSAASIGSLVACADTATKEEYRFLNAGFESGTLKGWSISGDAFTADGLAYTEKDENGSYYNYVGDFFFSGKDAAVPAATGSMLSEPFELKGNGMIGFLIGGGKDTSKCYVALTDKNGEEILAVRGNDEFEEGVITDALHRVVLDGSEFVGKTVRIMVVDEDDGSDGYNYINVDDFIVNYQGQVDKVGKLNDANRYVEANKNSVGEQYRMSYHLMPEIGWCNDPNGFVFYDGKIHQFYQFNPYSAAWDTMHWGHVTSTDFIKWEYQGVALAPDQSYDSGSGCFSGSAIVKDGMLYLMYTGVAANGAQQQCIAISSDGLNFEKPGRNPVISSAQVGPGCSTVDFRDPYVFKDGDWYYCVVGTKSGAYGQMVLYKSKTLTSWEYVGKVMNSSDKNADNFYQLSGVYECPAYAVIDGQPILICSPQYLPTDGNKFENVHSVVYMAGQFDYETGRFHYEEMREIDGGFDFYAAQVMTMPDGRVIMTAWMDMWDRNFPTQADGWNGSMILPRELSYKNGKLYQAPVREIENYRTNEIKKDSLSVTDDSVQVEGISGDTLELSVQIRIGDAQQSGVKVFKGTAHETLIYYNSETGEVVLDRSNSGKRISGSEVNRSTRAVSVQPDADGYITLRIFLDNVACEVFINDGEATLSAKVYADAADEGIEFYSKGGSAQFENIVKYDIKVN